MDLIRKTATGDVSGVAHSYTYLKLLDPCSCALSDISPNFVLRPPGNPVMMTPPDKYGGKSITRPRFDFIIVVDSE